MENAERKRRLPGVEAKVEEIDSGTAKFDLLVIMKEGKDGMTCRIEYNREYLTQREYVGWGGTTRGSWSRRWREWKEGSAELESMSEERAGRRWERWKDNEEALERPGVRRRFSSGRREVQGKQLQ